MNVLLGFRGVVAVSNYRRYYVPGGTYFFTVVTFARRPFLTSDMARPLLRQAIDDVREQRPFTVVAWVLLPDHLHAVWTLPPGDADYSRRWQAIKENFTKPYLATGGCEGVRSRSRRRRRERAVWQRRFWEHTVEDEDDLVACVDYVHWNPVKHGLVSRVRDWPWSTFHRFVSAGHYEIDWGRSDPCPGYDDPEWGE
jgi:putative transposase